MEENIEKNQEESREIDVKELFAFLLKRWLPILLAAIIVAGGAFGYTKVTGQTKYSSSVKMYVASSDGTSITQSILSLNKSLTSSYIELLYTGDTLKMIIDRLPVELTGGYRMTEPALKNMLSASTLNDTEFFEITVTDTNATRARRIANETATVLQARIETEMRGTVSIVEYPADHRIVEQKPATLRNGLVGFLAGGVLACGVCLILFLNDHYIHDEDYLKEHYDVPLFAVIPDLSRSGKGGYGKGGYGKYGKYGKYGYGNYYRNSASQKASATNVKKG